MERESRDERGLLDGEDFVTRDASTTNELTAASLNPTSYKQEFEMYPDCEMSFKGYRFRSRLSGNDEIEVAKNSLASNLTQTYLRAFSLKTTHGIKIKMEKNPIDFVKSNADCSPQVLEKLTEGLDYTGWANFATSLINDKIIEMEKLPPDGYRTIEERRMISDIALIKKSKPNIAIALRYLRIYFRPPKNEVSSNRLIRPAW